MFLGDKFGVMDWNSRSSIVKSSLLHDKVVGTKDPILRSIRTVNDENKDMDNTPNDLW